MFSRVLLSAALVLSGPVSAVASEGIKWAPYVDVEGKLGTDRNLGEVGLFVPLGQSQDSLFFGNLITRFDDQDSFEGNVGLGYREIVDGSYILGGYAYFDRRKSATDNYFNQVMAGAEFMTDVWTARANAYFADNDLAPTGGGVVTQTGSQIFVQSNMEGALSGFDAEVGRVIPLGLDDVTLTGFAGGFHFGRSGFEDVSGPRARAELSVHNLWDEVLPTGTQLRFGAEVQHDDVRDTQGFVSARLRVPLFGSSSSSNLSVLDRRMVDPVVRDIDVVAGGTLSAPVVPTFQGALVQGAAIINGNNDLGTELINAGAGSIVVIDGSNGPVTSATGAAVQSGQTVVGAQNAQFAFTDPTTGQIVVWNPTPNGVRPTVQGVLLSLPSNGVLSGIDFSSSLVLPQVNGVLTFSNTSILNSTFSGNFFSGSFFAQQPPVPVSCVGVGSNLSPLLNSSFSGVSIAPGSPIVAGGGVPATNLTQLTQLNLQILQAQTQNCISLISP